MLDQTASRGQLWKLLGDLPDRNRPISVEHLTTGERDGYVVEHLRLDLNGIEPVPAYFTHPKQRKGRLPTVLYHHASGPYDMGKEELLSGRPALVDPPYAQVLAALGIQALAIDSWGWGDCRGRPESALAKAMLWQGRTLWGMMVFDSIRALDYLVERDDVDITRLATLGLSMGSTMAWWIAALDPRIWLTVDLCCLTDFETLLEDNGLDGHGLYYYVPGLLKHFSTTEINSLIAPRPHLSLNGIYDPLTPLRGLRKIDQGLRAVYQAQGREEAWKLILSETGHFETRAMRVEIIRWLQKWLVLPSDG